MIVERRRKEVCASVKLPDLEIVNLSLVDKAQSKTTK